MHISSFKDLVPKLQKIELPGIKAQHKLAPFHRKEDLQKIDFSQLQAKKSAVMALFYPDEKQDMRLIFILRKSYNGVHSNQIGFPGGQYETDDKNFEYTAIRETEEEIGIQKEDITVVRELTQMYIPPSNFIVYPFLGFLNYTPQFKKQETEVETIFSVCLADCLNDQNIVETTISASYSKETQVNAFELNGQIVWGATAMMLSEIRDIFKEIV
ncbi:MAG: CoA pyrophosphatase [Psychroflexus sp.]|nr:CoA pyrophosphatase [Psychroflexus sp.]MDN6310856.1 CoA pyrophosphatase [Psychroflexus sp.]